MRGALSTTLAARGNGLQAIAVPQANALMAPKVAPSMQTGEGCWRTRWSGCAGGILACTVFEGIGE